MRRYHVRRFFSNAGGNIFAIALFAVIIVIFISGIQDAAQSQRGESLRIARESITRAVISCYVIEGAYPPSYEYLKENYHIRVDESRHTIHYYIFASNIMPNIDVLEN